MDAFTKHIVALGADTVSILTLWKFRFSLILLIIEFFHGCDENVVTNNYVRRKVTSQTKFRILFRGKVMVVKPLIKLKYSQVFITQGEKNYLF